MEYSSVIGGKLEFFTCIFNLLGLSDMTASVN